jgi:hypothetical protein
MSHEQRLSAWIDYRTPYLVQFLEGWWRIAKAPETRFRLLITRFEDLKRDYNSFFRSILGFYEIPWEEFTGEPYVSKPREHAFRKGAPDEWRTVLSPANQERLAQLIPNDLLTRYGWTL